MTPKRTLKILKRTVEYYEARKGLPGGDLISSALSKVCADYHIEKEGLDKAKLIKKGKYLHLIWHNPYYSKYIKALEYFGRKNKIIQSEEDMLWFPKWDDRSRVKLLLLFIEAVEKNTEN